jgi:uncharacterized membrane protein YgcG
MKSQILLLALAVGALSSCTTSYKTCQTPDDVYYSPVRQQDEYVQTKKEDNRYETREQYYDDRYLRMRVNNRQLWSELDDYYYFGNRYDYSYYNSFYWNNPWSPCSYWNNYYNPYYHSYVIVSPNSPVFNHPRTVNLNTYNNNMLTNNHYSNPTHPGFSISSAIGNSNNGNGYNNNSSNSNRSSSNAGNFLRNIFNNSGSSGNNNSSSGSSHPGTSSSSSGGGSGSSGGGSAPVRRF